MNWPIWLPSRPNAARQALAGLKFQVAGRRFKLGSVHLGAVPRVEATQLVRRRINQPQRAKVPTKAGANGLNDARPGFGHGFGLRQFARDRVLQRRAPFGELPFEYFRLQPVVCRAERSGHFVGHRQRTRTR